ncbi:MAG: hypothetical protein QOD41_2747, partial [Cryptosporangiaceae bacterium]|nr:hypothetical protein [Cryptosporangiaceae bacterium]
DGLSEADLRALHQRIAEALDGLHPGDSEYVYAVARHYELGEPGQDPARAYRAAVTAGRLALANHAPYQTLEFLDAAQAAADAGKLATGTEFHEAYGVACVRVGRFAEARGQLYFALADETVPVRRAMLHALVSQARQSDWEMPQALAAADDALAEIGRALPKNKLVLIVSTFTAYLMSLLIRWTGIGRGTATGEKRERMRIEAIALAEATQAAVTLRNMMLVSCLQFRQLYPANRIGYGPEYVKAHANMAAVAKIMGLRKLAARMFKKIAAVAVGLGDPRLVAYVNWVAVIVEATIRNSKIDNGVELRRVLAEHGRWLDAQETFNAVAALCNQLAMEGHIVEAQAWYERAKARANQVEPGPSHNMSMITPPLNAVLGRGEEATRQLDAAAEFLDSHPENREQLVTYVQQSLLSTVELGQLDDRFEKTVQLVADLRLTTWNTWPMQHHIWLSIAYGRLAQCLAAPEHALAERLAAAQVAVRRARKAATSRLAKAHLLIVQASFAQLSGDPQKALKLLAKADRRDRAIDAPVLAFEIARVRARAFGAMGNPSHARQHARLAISLAGECGWEGRARAVHAEFGLAQNTPFLRTGSGSSTVSAEVFRRRLDALQQVSSAAATVLDPRELAKVALRETIEIVRAERAFLFLVDDSGDLVPHLGRDAAGNDLDEVTGYGASLVRRVHRSGEPLVVTGAEDGEVHGSQSAVVHGLRSILVAPVRLKGRMLGVLYVDSRVAKGIFTKDDVDILMAITNHVAVSLETARAAQLEAAVRATSQQRDLAELLRSSMTEFSATLDPDEVLRRLLGAVSGALPGESACLLRWDGASFLVAAGTPEGGRVLNPDETESVVALASRPGATLGNAGPGRPVLPPWLLPAAASWIAIPLAARGTPVGLLVVASAVAGTYTDAHLQIAAALAGQGMTAYDNADLFAQVNRLAAIDPMTGVPNRRTFLADAGAALLSGAGSPMSALMLDIDHFKRVNDT